MKKLNAWDIAYHQNDAPVVDDWQHVKGNGYIVVDNEERHDEIHWSRCENIVNIDRFIKRWLDEADCSDIT